MRTRRRQHRIGSRAVALWVLACFAVSPMGPAGADPDSEGWELAREADGIRCYKKVIEGSHLLGFKAEAVIDAPIDVVVGVLFDPERASQWIPRLSQSKVVRWIDEPWEYIQFSRFDAPWPVSDRVFLSRVTIDLDEQTLTTGLRYEYAGEPDISGGVLAGSADGSQYIATPIDGGRRTFLSGISMADPRGYVPAWLVNWMGTSWAHDTIVRLRTHVARDDIRPVATLAPIFARFHNALDEDRHAGEALPAVSIGPAPDPYPAR